jgi:hypothetical protein
MCVEYVELKVLHWGNRSQVARLAVVVCWVSLTSAAAADPPTVVPDAPARSGPVVVPPATFRPSWDLDGVYLWLGPVGAASHVAAKWDSTFGAEATLGAVHEASALGLLGASLGASRWSERGGGRIWLDGLAGTRVWGRMMGASLGPIVELSDLERPKLGASIGLWGYVGIAPFVRLGGVSDLGMFVELGVHIALPVLHR